MKILNMIVAGLFTLPDAVGAREAAPAVDKIKGKGVIVCQFLAQTVY